MLKAIIDILFPKYCLICGKPGQSVCNYCSKKFIPSLPECYICRRLSQNYRTHQKCRKSVLLDNVFWGWQYNKTSSQLIKTFKYKDSFDMQNEIGHLLAERISKTSFMTNFKNPILVPVPIHNKRQKERGFNQSLLIAQYLSNHFSIPLYSQLLTRDIYEKPQAQKDRIERNSMKQNVFNFDFKKYEKESGYKEIILVDDVITTGTTLDTASGSIKKFSKKIKISAITLFRGKPNYSSKASSS